MRVHQMLYAGMADADTNTAIVIANMRGDRAQAVVPRDPAADLHPHLGRCEVELIVEDHDLANLELVEARSLGYGASRLIHISAGQQQQHPLRSDRAFHRNALEAASPGPDVVARGERPPPHE